MKSSVLTAWIPCLAFVRLVSVRVGSTTMVVPSFSASTLTRDDTR